MSVDLPAVFGKVWRENVWEGSRDALRADLVRIGLFSGRVGLFSGRVGLFSGVWDLVRVSVEADVYLTCN